ncbi:amino acid ABC transporter ATP-binding protein [Roseomonas elaeocarpi]|uniref:Amino acid ABC transporter ATP-binding protein n=1 Tax=Roseomonas elaeocarpi TaxID=907779 RepID=A0ABV6K280_9PROT
MTELLRVTRLERRVGDHEILRNIDLSVARGEVLGIIGPSGSGKSSLLRCIAGLDPLSGGSVTVEGKLARPGDGAVGMVFQNFALWPHLSAEENVAMPLRVARKTGREEARAIARRMLDRVGLAALAERKPATLSGGQQQRVAIARTLAARPRLILFDEPTASLDPELTTEVLDVIRDLAREGLTMLVVSHEMGFIAGVATRALFMEAGRVLVDGSTAEVFTHPREDRLRRFLDSYLSRVAWRAAEAAQ